MIDTLRAGQGAMGTGTVGEPWRFRR